MKDPRYLISYPIHYLLVFDTASAPRIRRAKAHPDIILHPKPIELLFRISATLQKQPNFHLPQKRNQPTSSAYKSPSPKVAASAPSFRRIRTMPTSLHVPLQSTVPKSLSHGPCKINYTVLRAIDFRVHSCRAARSLMQVSTVPEPESAGRPKPEDAGPREQLIMPINYLFRSRPARRPPRVRVPSLAEEGHEDPPPWRLVHDRPSRLSVGEREP